MTKMLITLLILIAGIVNAETYFVVYNATNGNFKSYDTHYTIEPGQVSQDGTYFTSAPWFGEQLDVLTTTNNIPAMQPGFTNISMLTDKTYLEPADVVNDYTQWSAKERKMLSLIVKEINILRVAAGLQPRTKQQVINALKLEE